MNFNTIQNFLTTNAIISGGIFAVVQVLQSKKPKKPVHLIYKDWKE